MNDESLYYCKCDKCHELGLYAYGTIVQLSGEIIVCRFCEKELIECACRADIGMVKDGMD